MHPIEIVHKRILEGKILDSSGKWITRAEALKKKRRFIGHVLSGKIEIDGKWVDLSEIDIDTRKTPEAITGTNHFFVDSSDVKSPPDLLGPPDLLRPPDTAKKEKNPFPNEKVPENPGTPVGISSTVKQQPAHHAEKAAFPPGLAETAPKPDEDENADRVNGTASLEKQTITIRSMPLGRNTVLTISESRAGEALVAVCSIQGYIDQTNANDLQIELTSMLDFGVGFFVIDFEQTNLVGSAGWGVLAVVSRLVKAVRGHLMLCSMNRDVEENFLLLQFNEVIDSGKTISECLYKIDQLLNLGKNELPEHSDRKDAFTSYNEPVDDLPLQEKIKMIIAKNGPCSFFRIAKLLKTDHYGNVNINLFYLYVILRELTLETHAKRVRFYRSC